MQLGEPLHDGKSYPKTAVGPPRTLRLLAEYIEHRRLRDSGTTFCETNSADVIVTDIELPDGAAINLCREAKALPKPPVVLVTTEQVHRVPEALEARCDGILLKPFAPNLLFARIGRMLRARGQNLASLSSTEWGTHRVWAHTRCPHCESHGITSFEFASHRRAWFACRQCKRVWLGKRQD